MKVLLMLLLLFTFSCKNDKKQDEDANSPKDLQGLATTVVKNQDSLAHKRIALKPMKEVNQIIPDSTVNKKLFLSNYNSLQNFYADGKNIVTIDQIRETPVVVFVNKSKTEYVIAYQYEGGTKNAFDCFEIGFLKNEQSLNKVIPYVTAEEYFRTETGISLGMSLDQLEVLKGSNYEKQEKESQTVVTYSNTDVKNSSFLKRYAMPGYFMVFTVRGNKIIKIKFGFDYP